ncbi:MAG: O-antigen polysaccharide polymerase Wzy [Gammaproteobacteria bacterium]
MLTRKNLLLAAVWAVPFIGFALLHAMGWGDVQTASVLLSLGAITIALINWSSHGGGRSPSFIFLAFLVVFLTGRAIPSLFGGESYLASITFGSEFEVGYDIVGTYVGLVLLSALAVHLGSLLPAASHRSLDPTKMDANIYLFLFFLCLPVYLYKNYYYFSYLMQSGGYLAIYLGSEHIEGVGVFIRVGALFCLAAFTLYFFHENDKIRARRALVLFLIVFSSELLVGLRGKFFVVAIMFLLFYKLRFGGKFSAHGLFGLVLVIFVLAFVVEVMRQGGTSIEGSLLLGFFIQQGATAGVNLFVLENLDLFSDNAITYFLRQFTVPFYSQPEVQEGWFLSNDISMMVMPTAYALGFGTGSSYLAELLLLGGWAGVVIGSLVVGWSLGMLGRFNQGVTGALMFWVACGIVYYPRTMLHDPVHNLMRYAIPIIALAACCWMVQRMWSATRKASAR